MALDIAEYSSYFCSGAFVLNLGMRAASVVKLYVIVDGLVHFIFSTTLFWIQFLLLTMIS